MTLPTCPFRNTRLNLAPQERNFRLRSRQSHKAPIQEHDGTIFGFSNLWQVLELSRLCVLGKCRSLSRHGYLLRLQQSSGKRRSPRKRLRDQKQHALSFSFSSTRCTFALLHYLPTIKQVINRQEAPRLKPRPRHRPRPGLALFAGETLTLLMM